jgi:hypothetical protein
VLLLEPIWSRLLENPSQYCVGIGSVGEVC